MFTRDLYYSNKRRKFRRIVLGVEAVALASLSLFCFGLSKLTRIRHESIGPIETNAADISPTVAEKLKGYTNIALFGLDNRTTGRYDSGQSDVIMIYSINNDTKEIRLASVYRDTLMDVDGEGKLRKCNYAYNHGGPEAALTMLNRNLDLSLQDFVAVDFKALTEAIDAVGGIDLTITEDEISPGKINHYIDEVAALTKRKGGHVEAGTQHVNGVQATAYCRLRYTASMDFGRAARQRIVLQRLFEAAKKAGPVKLNALIDSVIDDISTSLSTPEVLRLALAVTDYSIKDTTGYPFQKNLANPSRTIGSVVVPCDVESNVKELHRFLFDETGHEPSATVSAIAADVTDLTGFTAADAIDFDPAYEDASGTEVSK